MKLKLLIPASLFLLGGCAAPWVSYENAVRCHLDDKGPDCNKLYKKAISENTKMPGIHSSYGTHLLLQGNTEEANHEFKLEQENYPQESSKAINALLNPTQAAANNAPAPSTSTPVATEPEASSPAPAAVPVNGTPATTTKTTKSTSSKKDLNRAK